MVTGRSSLKIGVQGWFLILPLLFGTRKTSFFFISSEGWETIPGENLDDTPKFLRSLGTPVSGVSLHTCLFVHISSRMGVWVIFCFLFANKVYPCLKKQYHGRLERVKGYLETVSDFDEFISPQSLFIHFLGPKPLSQVWKNVEVIKKSKYFGSVG